MRLGAISAIGCAIAAGCSPNRGPRFRAEQESPPSPAATTEIAVPPPPFSEGVFPCQECHETLDANLERRALEVHDEIELTHGDRERWCFDCHNPEDRDVLRLASGTTVPFTESFRLCGQCHGDKLRDWRAGIHGKRTGMWNGHKEYLLCAHCHDPHAPRFKPLPPLPPPERPGERAEQP